MDLGRDNKVCELLARLRAAGAGTGPVKVDGVWGSYAPMLTAYIAEQLKRPILYVTAHLNDADNTADDIAVFTAGKGAELFPVWEAEEKFADATDEIGMHRLRITMGLWKGKKAASDLSGLLIATSVQALNQPVPQPSAIEQGELELTLTRTIEPELVITWLIDNGFEQVDGVDMAGQFARRGGIIDIFAPVTGGQADTDGFGQIASDPEPVRIEFFGDQIESIRQIDLDTQRSSGNIEKVSIAPAAGGRQITESELFINLLPDDTIIILDEPTEIAEVSEVFAARADDPQGLYPWQSVYQAMRRFTVLEMSKFSGGSGAINLGVRSAQEFEHKTGTIWKSNKAVLDELVKAADDKQVLLYCENTAEIKRVTEIIKDSYGKTPENLRLPLGFLQRGFIVDSLNTIVVTHHEVFGQYAVRRRLRKVRTTTAVESLADLVKGDYIVHARYGIGKFLGICTMEKAGAAGEYLTLEYAKKEIIHVPVSNIGLVQKYIGALPKRPRLSTIGSKKWEKQKEKVTKGVKELALELLEVQAKRQSMEGIAFGADGIWQQEFEETFLYQETADQLTSAEQIKADMMMAQPMDRLLCGDVGYGKTELAMRAAFKAIEAGKQVAVLVPTTVLCVQHGQTFAERFADFPVIIETLNRFVPTKRARQIVEASKQGKIDILIGTHRLLSGDVGFKDLGLLIIDEEQRFGVEHKERLKRFRINVDVLTMTATPIPRTLHMSLLGLRDISSLGTPPLDRRSIVTKVCRFDPELIRRTIMHEISRDGQVFFVHNRVQSIEKMAEAVRRIVDDKSVRVSIAHGQMAKRELEGAMIDFVTGRTDVLVCSAIIESGLDIPNANTMIINNADRFGLAQLHQLRGRVGRYKHRAYAYMLLPMDRTITPLAAKRLKAIEEYSQLGAGFRIALRDLEIRGAGNILGSEQSGHINLVGYEMYCRLLADAVKRLKDEPVETPPTAVIDIGFSTYIPRSYIPSDRQRMDVYRRIAVSRDEGDLERMNEELCDMYGPVPDQVQMLLSLAVLRIRASARDIKSIVTSGLDVVFSFKDGAKAGDLFDKAPGKVRVLDAKTINLRLEKNYFEPPTLMAVLRKIL